MEAGAAGIAIVLVSILVLIFLPYVFLLLELLVLPLLFGYRILFGKPWTVEARSGSERLRWQVEGWRRAGEVGAEVVRALERGQLDVDPAGTTRL